MSIALSKEKVQAQHGIMVIYSFITLFIVNSLLLYIGSMLFPQAIVLGTASISTAWAIYHSMLELTLISIVVMLLVTVCEWKNKIVFTPKQWMGTYLVVNFISLWGISRFADNFGLGFSSWLVILLSAVVLDIFQGMSMMALGEKSKQFLK